VLQRQRRTPQGGGHSAAGAPPLLFLLERFAATHSLSGCQHEVRDEVLLGCNQLGYCQVVEVQFGGKPPDVHFANMRAWMWSKMRDFLTRGSIDKSQDLETDLTGPGYHHDKHDRMVLESKEEMLKRGLASPDDGDALALTFAQQVQPTHLKEPEADMLDDRDPPFSSSFHYGHGGWMR
jgi:hypothetical protein